MGFEIRVGVRFKMWVRVRVGFQGRGSRLGFVIMVEVGFRNEDQGRVSRLGFKVKVRVPKTTPYLET